MKSVTKRILIMFCCTMLLTSSVFMSYKNTLVVKAVEVSDLLKDAVDIALAAAGIWAVAQTGGAITPLLIPYIETLAGSGFDVYHYITQDETAGTTTISADFVDLVLQAYKRYQEENSVKFDGTMGSIGSDGYYTFSDCTYIFYYSNGDGSYKRSYRKYTNIKTRYPCAILARYKFFNGIAYEYYPYIVFYNKNSDEFYCTNRIYENGDYTQLGIIHPASSDFLCPRMTDLYWDSYSNSEPYVGKCYFDTLGEGANSMSEDFGYYSLTSSSIPIYTTLSGLKSGLRSGDFSGAYNYGKAPECETPAYTGTYDGGDITVPTEKLEGIQDKLDEIDKTDKDIYEKLKELLEWLIGHTGETGGSIDLTTTNSWLSKIYTKVSQIFDMLSGGSVLQEGFDTILSKLEDLNAMLKKYLSEITGDLDDIKGQLANMSEQEFNEKSDSFLGEVMDAFSEISEVVKTKFPFSIPNDLRIFLSRIAPAAPEAEAALYLNDTSGISLYSGEHGGGGSSDGEPNPPGGGGASRPGSGFVDVDHGGGGGSREPVEMREAPVFRLPIVIERYGIEEYIIIDMSPFDPLSRFSRGFFTIIFMVCLFNLTFKVIGMWGDLIG